MKMLIILLIPCVLFLLISASYAVILKKKLAETFILTTATIVGILFLTGLLNFKGSLLLGYGILIALALASIVILIIKKDKIKKISLLWGLLIFFGFLCVSIYLNYKRVFVNWDEFSHWGIVVKNMYIFDALGTYKDSNLLLKSYLPGTSLFQYFWARPFPQFTEYSVYIGSNMFFFSIISAFIKKLDIKSILIAIAFVLIPLLMGVEFYSTLYVDCIIGILFGISILYYYHYEYEKSLFGILVVTATSFLLTVTKDIGFIFSGISIAIILIDFVFYKKLFHKKYILKIQSLGKKIFRLLLLFSPIIITLAVQFLWKIHLRITGINSFWKISNINLSNIFASNLLPYQRETFDKFLLALRQKPLIPLNFSYLEIIITSIAVLIILVLLISYRKTIKRRLVLTFISLGLGGLAYAIILMFFYVFIISEWEALALASYERYAFSYVIGIFVMFVLLFITQYKVSLRKSAYKFKKYAFLCFTAATFGLLAYTTRGSIKNDLLLSRKSANETLLTRKPYDNILIWSKYISRNGSQNLYIISQGDRGLDKYIFAYTLYPQAITLLRDYSVGLKPYYPDVNDPWTMVVSPQEWTQYVINNYDLVYVFKFDNIFIEAYGTYFDNLKADAMYQVTIDNNNLRLVEITTDQQ